VWAKHRIVLLYSLVVYIVTTGLYRDKYSLSPSVATLCLVVLSKKPVYIPSNISKWQWELVTSNLQHAGNSADDTAVQLTVAHSHEQTTAMQICIFHL